VDLKTQEPLLQYRKNFDEVVAYKCSPLHHRFAFITDLIIPKIKLFLRRHLRQHRG
jgi:hypothetical protein